MMDNEHYCLVCEDAYGKLKVVDTCPPPEGSIKLYTQDQLEEARKLGMQQERALWNLSTSTQEIMDTHPVNELKETDLILILEVLIDSYDDTNRGFLEYEAMYKNSPMRKTRIDGMKRMVDKHTHAIEMVEAILRKAQE